MTGPQPPSTARERTLAAAIWPLLLIMSLMLMLSLLSVLTVSGLRAYTDGHASWAIAEHQAVEQLHRYSRDSKEASWQRYLDDVAVPLGDRIAREQLQQAHPDYALVRRELLAGRNASADITGMILLFRAFQHQPLMAHVVDVWAEADTLIIELQARADELHAEIASGHPDPQKVTALLAKINSVHDRAVPLERSFGMALGIVSRLIGQGLLLILPVGCALLLLAGVVVSRAQLRRDERMASALRDMTTSLRFQATHDALTELTNRPAFEALLATAIAQEVRGPVHWWLLYFDLDQFKVINDTCGHAAGDQLIRKVSWLVRERLQPNDVLARLGGDEFGVLLPQRNREAALALAEDIREQVDGLRFQFGDKLFAISASLGMLALDETVPSVGDALSGADQACYLAKDNGRNRVQIYHPDDKQMQTRHGEMRWVERIHAALEEDRFALVAQEIRPVGARNERGTGPWRHYEMLLRMMGPDGLVAPMAFIPAAERYGLMPRLDRWVIARVCRELAQLRADGTPLPTCMVNLSGTSVSDPDLADYIAGCLLESNLGAQNLGFELTETAAVANLAQASQLMARLRAMGCPIALDDFGSGMSSFSYLRNLPIDFLKIDGAFIRNISSDPIDYAMVETIHRIGGIMGVRTIAESVENENVLATLALIGVDYVQGFHIRRPVPLEQLKLIAAAEESTRDVANDPRRSGMVGARSR